MARKLHNPNIAEDRTEDKGKENMLTTGKRFHLF